MKSIFKKRSISKKSNSLKALFFYIFFVLLIILISLLIKIFFVISESRFDGQHRFTLAIGNRERVLGFISFEPITTSLSVLTLANNSNLKYSDIDSKIGIIPDGYIKGNNGIHLYDSVPSLLQLFFFDWNKIIKNITYYDLLRFWIYSIKIPPSNIYTHEITTLADKNIINKTVTLLFADSAIISEKISIQIINSAGVDGLGARLGRIISNMGGNVVSVQTALDKESDSKIIHNGRYTYTLKKIRDILPYQEEVLNKQGIAEIVILIATDSAELKNF